MVTVRQLARSVAQLDAQPFLAEHLVEQVLANGRELPLRVRMRLTDPGRVRAVGVGLALKRAVELSVLPSDAELRRVVEAAVVCAQDPELSTIERGALLGGLEAYADLCDSLAQEPGAGVFQTIDTLTHRLAIEVPESRDADSTDAFEAGLDRAIVVWCLAGARCLQVAAVRDAALSACLDRELESEPQTAPLIEQARWAAIGSLGEATAAA